MKTRHTLLRTSFCGFCWVTLFCAPFASEFALTAVSEACKANPTKVAFDLASYNENDAFLSQIPQKFQVRSIRVRRLNIFDETTEANDNFLYQGANRLHWLTSEGTVRNKLLFKKGDTLSLQQLADSERLLRKEHYLYGAVVRIWRICGDQADIEVITRDTWSMQPSVSFAHSGGQSSYGFSFKESNLFGLGKQISIAQKHNDQRSRTLLEYKDSNLFNTQWRLGATLGSNSDGNEYAFQLEKPFLSVIDQRAFELAYHNVDSLQRLYLPQGGDEALRFDQKRQQFHLAVGHAIASDQRDQHRIWYGYDEDNLQFDLMQQMPVPAEFREQRHLAYPWLGYEFISDQYEKHRNLDRIGVVEDVFVGMHGFFKLGYSSQQFGATELGYVFDMSLQTNLYRDENNMLFLDIASKGYLEPGKESSTDTLTSTRFRYYYKQSELTTWYFNFEYEQGLNLNFDNQLLIGGQRGLRGYPANFQSGDRRILLQFEKRRYTNWQPFKLARIGYAYFIDAGRAWDGNAASGNPWLTDVGFGLRIAPTRAFSKSVLHLDLAFPLQSKTTDNNYQFSLQMKKSF